MFKKKNVWIEAIMGAIIFGLFIQLNKSISCSNKYVPSPVVLKCGKIVVHMMICSNDSDSTKKYMPYLPKLSKAISETDAKDIRYLKELSRLTYKCLIFEEEDEITNYRIYNQHPSKNFNATVSDSTCNTLNELNNKLRGNVGTCSDISNGISTLITNLYNEHSANTDSALNLILEQTTLRSKKMYKGLFNEEL